MTRGVSSSHGAVDRQRVYALCLTYEDLNDYDAPRRDLLRAVLADKSDPLGEHRPRQQDRGKALAGKRRADRLELTPVRALRRSRYKEVPVDRQAAQNLFVDVFLQAWSRPPARIELDLDATDDPLHGHRAGRFQPPRSKRCH